MTLLYRAVWDDDWCEPPLVLDDEFRDWCISKGIDEIDIPRRGRFVASDRLWIDIRRADAEIGRAVQCVLCETDNLGRTWTTTATALADSTVRSFWVDLECEDPNGGQPELAAPRLVRGLINNGGRPSAYRQPLTASAKRIGPEQVDELVEALLDPNREVPIVVFSADVLAEPPTTIRRADAAAATLAGLAHVYAVSPLAGSQLNAALPTGFGVFGGAVRLYLPHLRAEDPDDSHRHRWIPLRLISAHPRRAASMLASRLARLQLHPPIPALWPRLSPLLRRPTDAEIDARAIEITQARSGAASEGSTDKLQVEIEELTKLLAEADLVREAMAKETQSEIARLERAVASMDSDRYDDADELEDLRRERDALQRTIRTISRPEVVDPAESYVDPHDVDVPVSIGEAVELAHQHLEFVMIPADALRDVDELEATAKYLVWASSIWQGLLALNDYALAKSAGEQPPGFKLWCERTGAWPSSKLAMSESDTVEQNEQLSNQRLFPVSTDVDPQGRIHMFSHLQIQKGGGNNIPRLYFCDDTDGSTRKMHVGFIGPHRHVRNTRS